MRFDLDTIREEIIGRDCLIPTPFGERHLLYADFTASGRGLHFVENRLENILNFYANTHTEDDYTGKFSSQILRAAEEKIKKMVNAGPGGKIIPIGSGTTGALKKLQEIIGVYIPPATRDRIFKVRFDRSSLSPPQPEIERPVVFIGPYEHHTNELMWREALVDVVVVGFNSQGLLDLADLEEKLAEARYRNRQKITSISAGSNITGIRTPVYDVARISHRNDALVFFDFAAVAPYIEIDMNHAPDCYFDAVFFSPHKFLGGPGSSGILIFNERIYRRDLPPTTAGGGTVVYVGFERHDFSGDIEAREKAGTPPILQTIKAALALEVKERIGVEKIEELESRTTGEFISRLRRIPNISLIGNADPQKCLSIVSFNIKHKDRILHPKFVTKLLNDLFGIQSRAGCSCAGPYGHVLLRIEAQEADRLRGSILRGCNGLKPGWVRINLHYTFSRDDIDFLLDAIAFVGRNGPLFLRKYSFDMNSAEWSFRGYEDTQVKLSIENDFAAATVDTADIPRLRREYLKQAEGLAKKLRKEPEPDFRRDDPEIEALKYFYYV